MAINQAARDLYPKLEDQRKKVRELREVLAKEELVQKELEDEYRKAVINSGNWK